MDSRVIAELILHLGRITARDGVIEGLTPGQWAVLRYFGRANRFSRTPSAFAAFQGTTRGTASQAIKNMVAQGYLTQTRSETDGRSVRLDLTDDARAIFARDPLEALARAADALPPGVRGHFSHVLYRMLAHITSRTDRPFFGTCENCAHFENSRCCKDGLTLHVCGFLNEPLRDEDLDELCISFTPGKSAPPRSHAIGTA